MNAYISAQILEAQRVMTAMLEDATLLAVVEATAQACIHCPSHQ